jgi:hypothetical protein
MALGPGKEKNPKFSQGNIPPQSTGTLHVEPPYAGRRHVDHPKAQAAATSNWIGQHDFFFLKRRQKLCLID